MDETQKGKWMAETSVQRKRLIGTVTFLVLIGSLFMVAKTINEFKKGGYIGRDVSMQNTITVSGDGEVFAKPDIATFTFSVIEEAKTVAEAQQKATEKNNKAMEFLEKSGVNKDKDIKTIGYNIYPKYEYYTQTSPVYCTYDYCPPSTVKNPKIIGYEVSQTIEVKVRDLAKAGDLLAGIGTVGVSNVSGLYFAIENEDAVKNEARDQAIREAKDKANELAKQLGVSLVRIVNFSENGSYPYYYARTGAVMNEAYGKGGDMVASAAPSVPTGENQIVSNVTIVYEIK